jgi:hypothetical protein
MFWDTSALIPLVLPEPRSVALTEALATDREVTLWWGTPVECLSATYRRHRETPLPAPLLTAAIERLRAQLAAALVWCEEQSAGEVFVCLDDRLREAARREGFSLLPA